jgi:hypothetical protein
MFHHCYNIQGYKNIDSLLRLPEYSWTLDLYTGLEIWCYCRIHPHLFNGHWMVSYKVFFVDQKYTKETRGPKISKRVCAYIWVYIVYMFLMNFLLMHSLRKSPSETCITILCNYYYFWHKRVQKGLWDNASKGRWKRRFPVLVMTIQCSLGLSPPVLSPTSPIAKILVCPDFPH